MRRLISFLVSISLFCQFVEARQIGVNPTGVNSDIQCIGGRIAGNTVKNSNEICIDSNGNIIPTTLNNQTVGSSAFPLSSVWIGTSVNNGTGLSGVQLGTPAGIYIGTTIVAAVATAPILSLSGRMFTSVRAGTAGPAILSNSCGGTAGGGNTSSALVTGSDFAGIITLGTGNPGACTLAFGDPFVNTPICSITVTTGPGFVGGGGTGNPIVLPTSVQFNTKLSSPATINYICVGQNQ